MRTKPLLLSVAIALGIALETQIIAVHASPPQKATASPAARDTLKSAPQAELPVKAPRRTGPAHPALDHAKVLGAPVLPDLVATRYFNANNLPEGFPGIGFCDPNPAGGAPNKIRFRLTNQGASAAQPSVVRVDFAGGGSVSVNAPALMPGAETSGAVGIPQGCFPPGFSTNCSFTVTVDSNAQVAESVEGNNAVQSFCVGPAG